MHRCLRSNHHPAMCGWAVSLVCGMPWIPARFCVYSGWWIMAVKWEEVLVSGETDSGWKDV